MLQIKYAAVIGLIENILLFWIAILLIVIVFTVFSLLLYKLLKNERLSKQHLMLSEKRFRTIFEEAPLGIALVDSVTGVMHDVNPKYLEIIARSKEEMNNIDWMSITHPDDIREGLTYKARLNENKLKNLKLSKRYIRPDGSVVWTDLSIATIEIENRKHPLHVCMAEDITERKKMEDLLKTKESKQVAEALRISKGKLEAVFNGSNDAIMLLTRKGFFDCNPRTLEMFGMSDRKEFIESHPSDLSPALQPDGQKSLIKANAMIEIAFEKGINRFEWVHQRKSGENFPAEVLLSAFNYGDEYVLQATVHDITERKKAEEKIKKSEEKYRSVVENAAEIIMTVDDCNNIQFINHTSPDTTLEQVVGTNIYSYIPQEYQELVRQKLKKVYETQKLQNYEMQGQHRDGSTAWYSTNAGPLFSGNEVTGITLIVRDISERKKAEEKTQQSLQEKEVLLKEVHHRVKNNLQIILSILNLQYDHITDKKTLELLRDIRSRIKAMSFIHELLYQTNDFSSINFSEYISNITNNLVCSYTQNHTINLKLDVDIIFLDLDRAIPCGLIINEILTNALKYAFINSPNEECSQEKRKVSVSLTQKNKHIQLFIADNGKGFPNNIDYRNTESLGMQLVMALVQQLRGDISLDNSNGAKYSITFPV